MRPKRKGATRSRENPLPPRRYPEGTTPEDLARSLGFVHPHQRPEVQRAMKERRDRKAKATK